MSSAYVVLNRLGYLFPMDSTSYPICCPKNTSSLGGFDSVSTLWKATFVLVVEEIIISS
jgi:hypothetical protein